MNKKWTCLCLISVLLLYSCDSNKSIVQSTGTTSILRIESTETKETSEITSSSTTVAPTSITTETTKVIETTTESTTVETTTEQTTESITKTTKAPTKSTTEKPTTTEAPMTTTEEPSEEPTTTTTEEPTTTTTEATTTTEMSKKEQGSLGNTSGSFNKSMANEVLTLVNQEREANGVAPLSWSNSLAKDADIRATELVVSFSHTRPDGSEWWTAGDQLQMAENLAFGQQSASEVVADWMGSTGHRTNILKESYTSIGISCYYCDGVYYWAQEFA